MALIVFGAVVGDAVTGEAAYVAAPIRRTVTLHSEDGQKYRVRPILWSGFTAEQSFLDTIKLEVLNG